MVVIHNEMTGREYRHKQADWTLEQVALLTELWPDHTGNQIADRFYQRWPTVMWTRNMIIGKANRLNLPRKETQTPGNRKMGTYVNGVRPFYSPSPPPPPAVMKKPDPFLDPAARAKPTLPTVRLKPIEEELPMELPTDIGKATLFDVGREQCRFPMWAHGDSGAASGHSVCGHKVKPGSSYCRYHYAKCYVPVKKSTRTFVSSEHKNSLISRAMQRETEVA